MLRLSLIILTASLALVACAPTPSGPTLGADGKPLPKVYRIGRTDTARIQYRLLDATNALRMAANAPQLRLNAELTAAAMTHSRDMSLQNRPWHFGSDGSSPLDRVRRAGYPGMMLGENISETFETELETLAAWIEQPETRAVLLDPAATDLGIGYFQTANGKIWWTVVTGG